MALLTYISSLFSPLPKYVSDFIKSDYQWSKYVLTSVFLAFCIALNYWISFEANFVAVPNYFNRLVRYIAFYGFAYYGGVVIIAWSKPKPQLTYLKNSKFWLITFTGIIILSFDNSFHGSYNIAKQLVGLNSYLFVGKLFAELRNFVTLFLPLLVFWFFIRQKKDSFFGLTLHNVSVRPYILMLFVMMPLIFLAAQSPSFLTTYPMFKSFGTEAYWGINIGWLVALFEFLYASAFLSVELFFRGFLVIGLTRIMGKDVIIPMVCLYTFLHFEKPMGEAISSVFGGYLLGVFAYYSKNIWGGVFAHAGIALLMEFAAALMKI